MMARLSSGVMLLSLNTGMLWGPVTMASQISFGSDPIKLGAYLP
jgi:hypothetical protein